ncbi:hypothetical protein D3C76_847780 [compost metagenome]
MVAEPAHAHRHRQRIDGVVDRLATDVRIFNIRKFHGVKLAGNLLGRKAFTQQINHQIKQLASAQQLSPGAASHTSVSHVLMSLTRRIAARLRGVAAKLSADGRGATTKQPGNSPLAHALELAKLNRDVFFDAEFLAGHWHTVPGWSGVALSFCRRPT